MASRRPPIGGSRIRPAPSPIVAVTKTLNRLSSAHYNGGQETAEYARVPRQSAIVSRPRPHTDQPIRSGLDGHESRCRCVPNGSVCGYQRESFASPEVTPPSFSRTIGRSARIILHRRRIRRTPASAANRAPTRTYGARQTHDVSAEALCAEFHPAFAAYRASRSRPGGPMPRGTYRAVTLCPA